MSRSRNDLYLTLLFLISSYQILSSKGTFAEVYEVEEVLQKIS